MEGEQGKLEKPAEKIMGKCIPTFPINMLKGLKEIEGYVVSEELSAAVFKGKLKGGGIQIPQHMQKKFREDEMILVMALQHHKKKER